MPAKQKPASKKLGDKDNAERVAAAVKAADDAGMMRVALLQAASAAPHPEAKALLKWLAENGKTHRGVIEGD